MAEKIKKTRPELLRQRRSLAMFKRFLPTLILKKQQIQMEILKVNDKVRDLRSAMERRIREIDAWVALFSESLPGPITRLVEVTDVQKGFRNVAGIELPVLLSVRYSVRPYSRFATAPWVDKGVVLVKELLEMRETVRVLLEQQRLLKRELRKVTQRVNLFEKVMIPRSQENIRIIRIQLAEEQTAGVGRAKIAKGKVVPVETSSGGGA
jgi:V/A-type H+-transporting ATPase subunit D